MNNKKLITYAFKLLLILGAIGFVLYSGKGDFENLWTIPLYLIAGYYFGKVTCGTHSKKMGFAATLVLFGILNIVHSLIDGLALVGIANNYRSLAIASHELIRQPALYVIVWATLQPFQVPWVQKVLFSFLMVTGIWALGTAIGMFAGGSIQQIPEIHGFLTCSIFIFVGDIVHHMMDEFRHVRKTA